MNIFQKTRCWTILLSFGMITGIVGLTPDGTQAALTVEIMTGYNLVVDSNVTSPSTYAPQSAYIGAEICNTGSSPLEDVFAYAGDYLNGTPGIYPTVDSDDGSRPADWTSTHLNNTGEYSLFHEGGSAGLADATRYVGDLDAGECRMQYWLISYPQCVNVDPDGDGVFEPQSVPCDASITGGVKPDDDLTLSYDVWAVTGTSGTPDAVSTNEFTMRNEISAAANKIWPNTTSKVPDVYLSAIENVVGWGILGPDGQPLSDVSSVYPGQKIITTQGIWYDLGNVSQGFDNDGDLIPDQNAWLQPIGDPEKFDSGCFRFVGVYGIVIVKLKDGGELLIPFEDQLYFENLPDNNGVVGLVYYRYIPIKEGCSSIITPYQEAASGNDNEKFSGDFGLPLNLASGLYGSDLNVAKTDNLASGTAAPGSTITYTISATNNTGVHLGAPDFGVPLVFTETIPEGTTYISGTADDALTAPSGTGSFSKGYTDDTDALDTCVINYNVTSSEYNILYSNDNGASWSDTEPSGVTDIQWILTTDIALDGGHDGNDCIAPDGFYNDGVEETSLPAGQSIAMNFQAVLDSSLPPVVCNTAGFAFGGTSSAVDATECTLITGDNTISGAVFEDNGGSTGVFGNGVPDGDEAGVGSGVEVTLYYDLNGDGQFDSGDIQYGSTTTDAGGAYSFTGLPDGPYLVTLKKYDGETDDGIVNAVNDLAANTGWGNTTYDPGLPTTTDQGVVQMTEDATGVTLAVNLDLDGSDGSAQSVTDADFGFAPPLEVTKIVAGNADTDQDGTADVPIDEGDVFSYAINLENRLPSMGIQGPTGCEYTVWSASGFTGKSPKDFTNPENVWNSAGPDRAVASAQVAGGGLRWISGTGFGMSEQPGTITKVEALYFGYFDQELTDDFLELMARIGSDDTGSTFSTAKIESYVGAPADLDPNSSIPWNITEAKPGGTGSAADWDWTDFSSLELEVNPSKDASADEKMFYLDAIGLRVTTDADCSGGPSSTLEPVPLQDTYDPARFEFVSADPMPTYVDTAAGVIQWNDVGAILPGSSRTVTVTLRALDVSGSVSGTCSEPSDACNSVRTDFDDLNVYYADGRQANDDSDDVAVDILGKAEIHGSVWDDLDNDGWPNNDGEAGLPNVSVTLYACVQEDGDYELNASSKTCEEETNGNTWQIIATTTTDENGDYAFLGLNEAFYIVEVGDTDGNPPGAADSGDTAVYGGIQTAEADDIQSVTGGAADGHTCSSDCNGSWGNSDTDLRDLYLIDATAEEQITGVDFGYSLFNGTIYGSIWFDMDGDAGQEPGETGLSGFTVELDNGTCTPGTDCPRTTTDAAGNYEFTGLSPGDYTVVVTPPALPRSAWLETVESGEGTASLDNRISVTLGTDEFSGSHDFGYTQEAVSDIGDTLFYDFDGDGAQDGDEDGIPNITVYLYEDLDRDGIIDAGVDTVIASDVTDANGQYLFEDLPAGSYVVYVDTEDPDFPTNVIQTADPDTLPSSIDGQVLLGTDGLAGVSVLLYADSDGNGVLNTGTDQVIGAATTDVIGNYLFPMINTGNYFVDIDENSLPDPGLSLTSGDPSATLISLTDPAGTAYTAADAVYGSVSGFAVGDRVWSDADGDGVQDPGEAGIPGVDIIVTGGSCSPFCTATTDQSGSWIITGLTSGTYTVSVDTDDLTGGFATTTGGDSRTISVSSDNFTADFGYRYDGDDDGVHDEDEGDPTGIINGTVYLDGDGDQMLDAGEELNGTTVNLLDNSGNLVATTTTDANGDYSFDGVPIGKYSVEAVNVNGVQYSTIFLSAGDVYSDLDVIYNAQLQTAIDNTGSVSVTGAYDNLMQDFGWQRFMGSIGDTVYLDVNENSDRDFGEPGIDGVTVNLYLWADGNGDGLADAGELTLTQTTTTTADDPLTAEDESGKYLFTNLTDPPVDQYYVVRVDASTIPGTPTLIGDPDTDGYPCTLLPDPDDPDDEFPPPAVCDSQQTVTGFTAGINYLGADFGYSTVAPGYASFGDTLWVDTDGSGTADSGENGVRYVTVYIDTDDDGVFDWTDANGNGQWDPGEGEQWVESDVSGYYVFTGMDDGIYNVRVNTDDPDWPPGLPTVPVSEPGATTDNHAEVVISGGVVTEIEGSSCTDCDLAVDFGYQYSGTNTVHGTICIDDESLNGYCGATATTYSGVDTGNEGAISGMQVAFYLWNDDGDNQAWAADGTLDSGDSFILLGETSTDANGNYSYDNLPDSVIAVMGVPPTSSMDLSTTNGSTSVEDALSHQLYELTALYDGGTVTSGVRQALDLSADADDDVWDLDFAFAGILPPDVEGYDFGDLPSAYSATLLSSGGAQHIVETTSIHLGAAVSTEVDGQENATASGDSNDDGVTLISNEWTTGTDGAGVTVTASDAGWLAGWIDFNLDGDFNDAGERIVNRAVSAGENTIAFDVPAEIPNGVIIDYFVRFRIYPEQPLLISSTGMALNATFQAATGEVEDYLWSAVTTYVMVSSFKGYAVGGQMGVEWRTSAEVGTIGYHLLRQDPATGEFIRVNDALLPSIITSQAGGVYYYRDFISAVPGDMFIYQLMEVTSDGKTNSYGPFTVVAETASGRSDEFMNSGTERYFSKGREMSEEKKLRNEQAKAEREEAKKNKWNRVSTRIKIRIREQGIYYIDAEDLAPVFDLDEKRIRQLIQSRHLNVTGGGQQIAWMPEGKNDGIYFYGEGIESIYTDDNVYWVEIGKGLEMKKVKSRLKKPGEAAAVFTRNVHAEENVYAGTGLKDPEADYWLWDFLFAGYPVYSLKSYKIQTPSPDLHAETATLVADFLGGSENPASPDHHAVVRINGTEIGGTSWNDLNAETAVLNFDASLLNDGENTIEVEALVMPGVSRSIFYVDAFDLEYDSFYRADDGQLAFRADGNEMLTVSNFDDSDIFVLNVTDPARPLRMEAEPFRHSEGGFAVTLEPDHPEAEFFAASADAVRRITELIPDESSDLKSEDSASDYLLIAPYELKTASQALADYRRADGYAPLVVDLEDIMDEFNDGVFSPWAVRDFLAYAYENWAKRPAFAVLIGDGTYDYKNHMGLGGNLIPPIMVTSPYGIIPADNRFGDVLSDDGVPEIAIGRIPVLTSGELSDYIEKVMNYEARNRMYSRVLMLADNPDKGGDFPSDSDSLISILPDAYEPKRIYLSEKSLTEARSLLFSQLNQSGFINYIGHGSIDRLAQEGLLTSGDLSALTGGGISPVMTFMTCLAGRFDFPTFNSIAESLVLQPDTGASAVWTASGQSVNANAKGLITHLFREIFIRDEPVLGLAVRKALEAGSRTIADRHMLDMYNLFGDPALRMH